MPRVREFTIEKRAESKNKRICNFLESEMRENKITQKMIADEMHLTQPAISYQFRNHCIAIKTMLVIVNMCGTDLTKLSNMLSVD